MIPYNKNTSRFHLLAPVLFAILSLHAGAAPAVAWKYTYKNGPYTVDPDAGVTSLLNAPGGDVITVGFLPASPDPGVRLRAWRHNSGGALVWEFADSGSGPGGTAGGVVDGAGNLYAAGYSSSDIFLVKITPGGSLAWRTVWDAGLNAEERASGIAIDSTGAIYVTGWGAGVNGRDLVLLKFDAAGVLQWSRRYDGTAHGNDAALAITSMPGGGVAVAGYTTGTTGAENYLTIRYSAAGAAQWVHTWNGDYSGTDIARAVLVDGSGNVIVGGDTQAGSADRQRIAVISLSSTGSVQWVSVYGYSNPSLRVVPGVDYTRFRGMALDGTGQLGVCAGPFQLDYFINYYFESGTRTSISPAGVVGTPSLFCVSEVYGGYAGSDSVIGCIIGLPAGGFAMGGSWAERQSYRKLAVATTTWGFLVNDIPSNEAIMVTGLAVDAEGNLYAAAGKDYTSGMPGITIQKWLTGTPPAAPSAVTDPADNVASSSARLNGTVNPNNAATTWKFEYGPTTAYGSQTATATLAAGGVTVPVSIALSGLASNETFHFRLVAASSAGTTYGGDRTFTTAMSPFLTWTVQKFGSAGAPGSAPGDDPDNDGLNNRLEYAFGGEPLLAGVPSGLPKPEMYEDPNSGVTYFAITYTVNPAATDVQYVPVAGNNLQSFSATNVSVQNLPNNRRRAVATGFEKFMRVNVTATP